MTECTVSSLAIYPLKGCEGVAVDAIELRRGGIVGDRELMLVKDGKDFAQRDHPQLARIRVRVRGDRATMLPWLSSPPMSMTMPAAETK